MMVRRPLWFSATRRPFHLFKRIENDIEALMYESILENTAHVSTRVNKLGNGKKGGEHERVG